MRKSKIACGLLILELGLAGTASAQSIEHGVHKITIDNSTGPSAESYTGNDYNREVRYTNSATNTDLGGRDYRETEYATTPNSITRGESTGTVLTAHQGAWANISVGQTTSNTDKFEHSGTTGSQTYYTVTQRTAQVDAANDTVGFYIDKSDIEVRIIEGEVNEEGTGVNGDELRASLDATYVSAYRNNYQVVVLGNIYSLNGNADRSSFGIVEDKDKNTAPYESSVWVYGNPTTPTAPKTLDLDLSQLDTYSDVTVEEIGRRADDPAKVNGDLSRRNHTVTVVDDDDGTEGSVQSVSYTNGNHVVSITNTGGSQLDLTVLDALEITLYSNGTLPTLAFGPGMPMGGLISQLQDPAFIDNTIANNGFAQGILGSGFVQYGLGAASPVTEQLPGGVPGQ